MYREHAITMGQPLASQLSVLGRYVEVRFLPQWTLGLVAHHILIAETTGSSVVVTAVGRPTGN